MLQVACPEGQSGGRAGVVLLHLVEREGEGTSGYQVIWQHSSKPVVPAALARAASWT